MLKLVNLSKQYDKGDEALKEISLEVPAGQIVALIGPSGAGKSTLIRCINRLVEPTTGTVVLDELNITSLKGRALRLARRQMAMIFQEYALIERLTVMENVLSGQLGYVGFLHSFFRRFPTEIVNEAYEILGRVDLQEHLYKRADELSGGQRQRVGIARAMLQRPRLLLVDEPTASLDPRTSRQIMRLLSEICQERDLTALVNIHDVALAQVFVDRIIGLKNGEIVFDGKSDELDDDTLTHIYGKEDWATLRQTGADDSAGSIRGGSISESSDEHMRGLS